MSDPTLGADEVSVSDQTEGALSVTLSTHAPGRHEPTKRGATISRYVVLNLAGAGAMGVVLAAYDPELDRKVAVKLLKVSGGPAQTRLQREAQALAKLDHPNVVGVYDVGTHEGQLFIAMEFVEGQTLGKWMKEPGHPRAWPEVVRVLSEAGRGLAAAHAAGLVHRDFKPENVMLGHDGRVRVMDFGLARTSSLVEDEPVIDIAALSNSHGMLSRNLTQTGAVMGTPAYMSIEQFEGRPADARSDQFGFCIALHEALYGERPFVDGSLAELLCSLGEGRFKPPPPGAHVPPWLRSVVLRGLSPDPEQRWPSMTALLDALADDPRVRRRKWIAGALTLALLGGVAATGVWATTGAWADDPTCQGLGDTLAGVWDDARRAELETAMLATKLSYAPGTWARLEPRLDAYARAWVDARTHACEATARGEQSSELLDLRMACLDRQLTRLRTTIDVLAHADAAAVEHAVEAVDKLPPLDACADREALLHSDEPDRDPLLAGAVAAIEPRVIEAETLADLGQIQRGLELIEAARVQAEASGDEAVRVRVSLTLGRLQRVAGRFQAAEATLRDSYRAAMLAELPELAAAAARALVEVVGSGSALARPADGREWAFHAELLTRAHGTREQYADYLIKLGAVTTMAGDYTEAREYYEQALELYQSLRPNHPGIAAATSQLGQLELYAGNIELAQQHYQRFLAHLRQTYDPTHPSVGNVYMSLGEVASKAGRWAEARAYLEQAVEVFEQALGPQHPTLGTALSSLGWVAGWQQDFEFGRAALERSVRILEASVGRDHYYYSLAAGNLGALAFLAGDYATAGEYYELARQSLVHQLGPEHPSVGFALVNLAELALTEGQPELALQHTDASLAILETKLGREHIDLLLPLETRGRALLGLERAHEAVEPLQRALAIHEREQHREAELVELRSVLAQAHAQQPQPRRTTSLK